MQESDFLNAISPFVPSKSKKYLWEFFDNNKVNLKITRDRKTKYGDFRHPNPSMPTPIISVNGGLNRYSFLITLLHEIAHYWVFKNYKSYKKPHGQEWKLHFQKTILPYFQENIFPEPLQSVLIEHMKNPKASTHSDLDLIRCLLLYDEFKEDKNGNVFLESLDFDNKFIFRGRLFIKGNKRRTRFLCTEVNTNNKYTINALAEVLKIEK